MFKRIAVIGGGITGVTTAYALVKRGFHVTLFEKHRYAAMETSFANGGQLSASNAEVWNHWSTILKGLKWMLTRSAPLLVNPKPSWHKLSWFAEFLAAIPSYRANTIKTAQQEAVVPLIVRNSRVIHKNLPLHNIKRRHLWKLVASKKAVVPKACFRQVLQHAAEQEWQAVVPNRWPAERLPQLDAERGDDEGSQ